MISVRLCIVGVTLHEVGSLSQMLHRRLSSLEVDADVLSAVSTLWARNKCILRHDNMTTTVPNGLRRSGEEFPEADK